MEQFTYTKADGTVSERRVVVLSRPSKNILALDVTDVALDKAKEVQQVMETIATLRDEMLRDVLDSEPKLRSFIPENITNKKVL
jgi:ribosomal protein L17